MTESSDPEPARAASPRVLVVEDQTLIALNVQRVLGELGCTVLGPVASVAKALDLIRREEADIALLNLNLVDGWVTPVAELLAARGVPFVLMTGYIGDVPKLVDPVLAGAPRLLKPFDDDELEMLLARVLARP